MNWIKIKRCIPVRVAVGIGGLALACLFLFGWKALAWWLVYWS